MGFDGAGFAGGCNWIWWIIIIVLVLFCFCGEGGFI